MAHQKLLTDEELTINAPAPDTISFAQPQNQEQAALLNTINNPPPSNPILQNIANQPASAEGPSFGREVANMLIGEVPVVGQILQKRHANAFQQEQQGQHLQALAESAKQFPEEQQQILGNLVQQGRTEDAFKTYKEFATLNVKQSFKGSGSEALRIALKDRIARIQDPVMRKSFEALALTDPKSALIQVGNFENTQFSQGMRSKSDERSEMSSEINANEGLLKDLVDDSAGKRAFLLQKTLREKNFVPEDVDLSPTQFRQKFGLDKKESSNIQLQLKNHIKGLKTGGIFGVGSAVPPEVRNDPEKLFGGVPDLFASPEALAAQKKTEEFRTSLQGRTNTLRERITKQSSKVKRASPDSLRQEAIKRGLIKQ